MISSVKRQSGESAENISKSSISRFIVPNKFEYLLDKNSNFQNYNFNISVKTIKSYIE